MKILAVFLSIVLIASVIAVPSASAQTFSVYHIFTGPPDGQEPFGGLLDIGGVFYGTTGYGGTGTCSGDGFKGCGTVFTLTKGKVAILHSFTGYPNDGAGPGYEKLVTDGKGNFYGTTVGGGLGTCKNGNKIVGCGTIFKITSSGTETVLYSFKGGKGDGYAPNSGLVLDSAGNLYGTTLFGGSGVCSNPSDYGCGIVFKFTSAAAEKILHNFTGASDGGNPWAGLVPDSAGNLYGTTVGGNSPGGTVFKISSSGSETTLFNFSLNRPADGYLPYGTLIRDSAGNLYGTTSAGGPDSNCPCGTVFKLTGTTLTVLHSFTNGTDGGGPIAGLKMDSNGNLYGTTAGGGTASSGTIFEISAAGVETVLWNFNGTNQGSAPLGALTLDNVGNIYGTTSLNGRDSCGDGSGCGTIFRLTP